MKSVRWGLRAGFAGVALLAIGYGCHSGATHAGGPVTPQPQTWTHPQGTLSVDVGTAPFSLVVHDAKGAVLLESAPAHQDPTDASDELDAYAPLAFTHNEDTTIEAPMKAWDYYRGQDGPWQQATNVTSIDDSGGALTIHLATTDGQHTVTLTIEPRGPGVHLFAAMDDPGTDPETTINRVSLGWKMHDDAAGTPGDHFLGLGERFYLTDHRGQPKAYVWVEDKGLGQGEDASPGPSNPLPNGPTMTYIPTPWFMSPRGFGLLLTTSYRSVFHLGEETPDAWRYESWTSNLDTTIFADPDPKNLIEDLTSLTGRPPAIADWVLAPRRRGDVGSGEWDKLRADHVPTSVIDTAVHYFPNGGGEDHASMKAVTADLHAKGFKAIAYFCPFVSDGWHPVFDELSANGWLVKHADGSAYTVLDPPVQRGDGGLHQPGRRRLVPAADAAGARRRLGRVDVRLRRVRAAGRRLLERHERHGGAQHLPAPLPADRSRPHRGAEARRLPHLRPLGVRRSDALRLRRHGRARPHGVGG